MMTTKEAATDAIDDAEQAIWSAIEHLETVRTLFRALGMKAESAALDAYIIGHLRDWCENESQCGGIQYARAALAEHEEGGES